ncbi:TPA: hypothetical protein ACSJUJ_000117 [Legionella pneumophila]|uniref:TraD protein n=1 Tax=Legionella pneumophila TaxID=446 RepID=A0AAP3HFT3_LEGPN|nr:MULTISPECIES: hypothetical protein [Legionella]ADG23845.1 traD Protein [Legionella pneumophila 2300/99 Alcoy]MCK1856863.1 hypothetical protein [Legionella pneumophila]MCO1453705.1 hypothetical protein [Legionella pneumophila]MCZ4693018.1 hypothetical protein [Legionella pneumophila]MCZ4710316.1 hypothetical protein [Legionella pneumophila]
MNKEAELMDVISEKLDDLMVPGFIAEVTPIEAEIMGAFSEDALSEDDAKEAAYD